LSNIPLAQDGVPNNLLLAIPFNQDPKSVYLGIDHELTEERMFGNMKIEHMFHFWGELMRTANFDDFWGYLMGTANFDDFCREFEREETCIDALYAARWPNGFRCPRCDHRQSFCISTRRLPLYECSSCRHQTSIIAGTVMEGSRTPLSLWFKALFLHSLPSAISATHLSTILGVTYKTAWLIGHKIRHAISLSDENEHLTGLVRLTPFVYGRISYSSSFRDPHEHPLVIGASLNDHSEVLHVKIKQVSDQDIVGRTVGLSGKKNFMQKHVDVHIAEVVSDIGRVAFEHSSCLKRLGKEASCWLNETFRGIGPKHLQGYLDQFSFQMNQTFRKVSVFNMSLSWCAVIPAVTYSDIVSRPSLIAIKHESHWSRRSKLKKAG
jgi:hypothetical protein